MTKKQGNALRPGIYKIFWKRGGMKDWLMPILLFALVVGMLACLVLQPAFEAWTFNKFRPESAPQATYWDALWADLRITSE